MLDYAAGKMDWLASDLPWDGEAELVGSSLDRNVPVCRVDDTVTSVRDRIPTSPACVVLSSDDIVVGLVPADRLRRSDATSVEEVMERGPTTVRPSEEIQSLHERMRRSGERLFVVTRMDGTFLGLYEAPRDA